MPRTCPPPFKVKSALTHEVKVHNIILCLSHESYRGVLHNLVREALHSIQTTFSHVDPDVDRLTNIVEGASHTTLMVVFFLLLNVDQTLKNKIISMDSEANIGKNTRFLQDLRKVLAVNFFTDETLTPVLFMDACVDCYLITRRAREHQSRT